MTTIADPETLPVDRLPAYFFEEAGHSSDDARFEVAGVQAYEHLIADRDVVQRNPRGLTKTRAALRNGRGEPRGAIRQVTLDWASVRLPLSAKAEKIEIVGPADGRPIIVLVLFGFPDLLVTQGNVILLAESPNGSLLTVESGATATVLVASNKRVSVTADAGATVDLYAADGSYGKQTVHPRAQFSVHGTASQVEVAAAA